MGLRSIPPLNPRLGEDGELYPATCTRFDLADFKDLAASGVLTPAEGAGFYADKSNYDEFGDVFSEQPTPNWATHVVWFPK